MGAEIFQHRQRVIYAQCTIGNHVYHSRYLDILEGARGEFMRALGYPLARLQEDDCIFPVISLRMKFLAPARYDEQLVIELWMKELTRVRLTVAARILNEAGKLFVEAETDHVCTSIQEKPKRIPVELVEKCQKYLLTPAA